MANIAPILNTRGPLYVHPKGIVKRTTFHVLAMYASQLQARVGKLDVKSGKLLHQRRSVPVLDALATVDEQGKLWSVALINRHPSASVDCTLRMKDVLIDGTFQATILAGASPEAFNDVDRPNAVLPETSRLLVKNGVVQLPPHSLTIVRIPWK